jgi:hypothetical protein
LDLADSVGSGDHQVVGRWRGHQTLEHRERAAVGSLQIIEEQHQGTSASCERLNEPLKQKPESILSLDGWNLDDLGLGADHQLQLR